jgi:hypothetical protein
MSDPNVWMVYRPDVGPLSTHETLAGACAAVFKRPCKVGDYITVYLGGAPVLILDRCRGDVADLFHGEARRKATAKVQSWAFTVDMALGYGRPVNASVASNLMAAAKLAALLVKEA